MALDQRAGGHRFNTFGDGKCTDCGMSLKYFVDNHKPRCKGKPADADAVKRAPMVAENE